MEYDLLTKPWIPLRQKDGTIVYKGIRDTLLQAQDYCEVSDAIITREFGVYRFLFAFLMDAYQPKTADDIGDLLDEGHFDSNVIDTYIENCTREGVSFNLFDPKRPFMQAPPEPDDTEAIKSVAYLEPILPQGNNTVYYIHIFQDECKLTVDEAARSLCAVPAFSTAGVQQYPATVNGAPPIFVIVRGTNLFETLVYGMVPQSLCADYADPPAYWRWNKKLVPKAEVPRTSLLFGLSFPCRRIRLNPSEDGTVQTIVYQQGLKFIGYGSFTDPYVAYCETNTSRVSLKPKQEREVWRDLGTILSCFEGAPLVVKQYLDLTDNRPIEITAYATSTNKASYLDENREEFILPRKLVASKERWTTLQHCEASVEEYGDRLTKTFKALQAMLDQTGKGGYVWDSAEDALQKYYAVCRQLFLTQLIRQLTDCELTDTKTVEDSWKQTACEQAHRQYSAFATQNAMSARVLMMVEKCRKNLNAPGRKN